MGEEGTNTSFMIITIFLMSHVTADHIKIPGMIYILEWTSRHKEPYRWMPMKRECFIRRQCRYQNCYLTDNVEYFDDVTNFDVILFNLVSLSPRRDMLFPGNRSDDQIYMFVSTESAANYAMKADYNMFFNWTWTYKVNSDVPFTYLAVWNKKGKVIGPAYNMTWVKRMKPTSKHVIKKLQNKRIAAAWFASNCKAINQRLQFVTQLQYEMVPYGLKLDIFGRCGNRQCPRGRMQDCYGLLETNYYFYLAFENSFSEDYITEKILTAAEHYTVPVLFGGANYSRFIPEGMYIDARVLGPKKTAEKMSKYIRNRKSYYDFFRFHRYYVFDYAHHNPITDPVCVLCARLNDKRRRNERRVYNNFQQWWNPGKTPEDPILYYETTTDSLQKKKPKIIIENPNKYAFLLKENDGGLLSQFLNYIFAT